MCVTSDKKSTTYQKQLIPRIWYQFGYHIDLLGCVQFLSFSCVVLVVVIGGILLTCCCVSCLVLWIVTRLAGHFYCHWRANAKCHNWKILAFWRHFLEGSTTRKCNGTRIERQGQQLVAGLLLQFFSIHLRDSAIDSFVLPIQGTYSLKARKSVLAVPSHLQKLWKRR